MPFANHVKNKMNATTAQNAIIQNAPLTPVKPSDFFFGAAFCCVVAINDKILIFLVINEFELLISI